MGNELQDNIENNILENINNKDDELNENISETTNSEENKETSEANCVALTVRKDYSLTVFKNGFLTGLRVSCKIAISTFILNLLRFLF